MSKDLIAPDLSRCQAEIKEGSFMTLGPRKWRRCENKPTWVITEKNPGSDGKRGSMSLCEDCKKVFQERFESQEPVEWEKI